MDGSTATFLYDTPLFSGAAGSDLGGILYIDDFDLLPVNNPASSPAAADAEPVIVSFSTADLEAAREAGRAEGARVALTDAHLVQAQLHEDAIQSLTDILRRDRDMLERAANNHAAEFVRATLAILQAAIPTVLTRHSNLEAEAIIQALVPGLSYQPELRVRANPGLADAIREMLSRCLPGNTTVLSVVADPKFLAGDVHIAWQDGQVRRDCHAIWDAIKTALAPLCLPSLEEVCRAN